MVPIYTLPQRTWMWSDVCRAHGRWSIRTPLDVQKSPLCPTILWLLYVIWIHRLLVSFVQLFVELLSLLDLVIAISKALRSSCATVNKHSSNRCGNQSASAFASVMLTRNRFCRMQTYNLMINSTMVFSHLDVNIKVLRPSLHTCPCKPHEISPQI